MRREVFGLGALQVVLTTGHVRTDRALLRARLAAGHRRRWGDLDGLHGHHHATAHRPVGEQPYPRPAHVRRAAVPGHRVRAAALPGNGAAGPVAPPKRARRRLSRRPGCCEPSVVVRWHCSQCSSSADGCCAGVQRHRSQPLARAVHAHGAAGGAGVRLGHAAHGLSMALGGFLAGMMLAETGVPPPGGGRGAAVPRAAARPLLHLGRHAARRDPGREPVPARVRGWWVSITGLKVVLASAATRPFVSTNFKALRTGIILAAGGEFGVALITICCRAARYPRSPASRCWWRWCSTMLISPFGIPLQPRHRALRIARTRGHPAASCSWKIAPTMSSRGASTSSCAASAVSDSASRASSRRRASSTSPSTWT